MQTEAQRWGWWEEKVGGQERPWGGGGGSVHTHLHLPRLKSDRQGCLHEEHTHTHTLKTGGQTEALGPHIGPMNSLIRLSGSYFPKSQMKGGQLGW